MTSPLPLSKSHGGGAWLLPLLLACFFLSGVTGLAYEVLWARYFSLFIGGTSYAHTMVLATFMGGLALGNAIFGRIADRVENRLQLCAVLEIGVALSCLSFPLLFGALSDFYLHIARLGGFGAAQNMPLKLVFCVASIIVPTVLMGGSLPLLARFIVRNMDDIGPRVGLLYFANTGGAVFGIIAAGFFMVPLLGIDTSTRTLALLNLAIGLVLLALSRHRHAPLEDDKQKRAAKAASPAHEQGPTYSRSQVRVVLVCLALSGAVSMAYELIWIRLLALVLGSSVHSFSIMLLTFIAGIAIGGLAGGRLLQRRTTDESRAGAAPTPPDALRAFAWAELGIFASVLAMLPIYERLPFYFHLLSSFFERAPHAFPLYLGVQVLVCVALMLIPTLLIGMTLPLATRVVVRAVDQTGDGVGRTFSINTVGTVIGAALTGLLVIPALGLQHTLYAAVALSLLLGLVLLRVAPGVDKRRFRATAVVATVIMLTAMTLLPAWDQGVMHSGLYRRHGLLATSYGDLRAQRERMEVLYHEDGPNTSVAVLEHKATGVRYLTVNGKTDAGTGNDMTTQLWLGHLGALLHPAPREALVIGLGSGVTAGALLAHDHITVDQVEISPAVVRASAWFEEANGGITSNPRYHLHVGDAKEYLQLEADRRFDIIVSEPSNPWMSGIGNLFSREFFEQARDRLADDGLLVQWIHLYEMSDEVLRVILDTFAAVFPEVTVWQCNSADMLLVGGMRPLELDMQRLAGRLARPRVHASLNQPHLVENISHPLQILASQLISETGFRAWFPGREPHNTDNRPILEYMAPQAFFVGEESTALQSLDERRNTVAENNLLIAAHIRENGLSAHERDLLREHHARRASAHDTPLLASLAAQDGHDPKLLLLYGGEANLRMALFESILAPGHPTATPPESWPPALRARYARDLIAAAHLVTSIYAPPPLDLESPAAYWDLLGAGPDKAAGAHALEQLAAVLERAGHKSSAAETLKRLLTWIEEHPGAARQVDLTTLRFNKGRLALERGDVAAAHANFSRVLGASPDHWLTLQVLSRIPLGERE